MSRHGNCHVCGTPLDATGFCWRCGGEAEEAIMPTKEVPKSHSDRCVGRGEDGRCQLIGSCSLEGRGGGLCAWHFHLAVFGWPPVDYAEFERFMEGEKYYETQYGQRNPWRAYSVTDWWDMVNGRDPKHAPRRDAERLPDRRCTREENLRYLRELRKMLVGKGGPMSRAVEEAMADVPF